MVGMHMGHPSHSDSLTGLLRLIKDPEAVEAHINKIKKAETDHQELLKKGRESITEQQNKLNDARAAHEAREQKIQERESALDSSIKAHEIDAAALEEAKKSFKEFELKTSAELSAQEEDIKQGKEELVKRHQDLDLVEKRLRGLEEKSTTLDTLKKSLDEREARLRQGEQELAAKAAKVKELLS